MSTPDVVGSVFFRRADNDTGRVHLVDHAGAAGRDRGARVTGDDRFHAGADERSVRLNQRHGLTLHVRAHESAVRVVVLEERDERGGDRHELLRRHVHEVDAIGSGHDRCHRRGGRRRALPSACPWRPALTLAWAMLYFASSMAER